MGGRRVAVIGELVGAVVALSLLEAPLYIRLILAGLVLALAYYTWLGNRVSIFQIWQWREEWRALRPPSGEWVAHHASGGDGALLKIGSPTKTARGFLCEVYGPHGQYHASSLDRNSPNRHSACEFTFPREFEAPVDARAPRYLHGMPRGQYLALWYIYDDGRHGSITTEFVAFERFPIIRATGQGVTRFRGGSKRGWLHRLPWPESSVSQETNEA